MGRASAIEWFDGGTPISRRDRLLSGHMDDVQREVYAFVFTMPPAPQDGYAPEPKTAQPKRPRQMLSLTDTQPTKVTIDVVIDDNIVDPWPPGVRDALLRLEQGDVIVGDIPLGYYGRRPTATTVGASRLATDALHFVEISPGPDSRGFLRCNHAI